MDVERHLKNLTIIYIVVGGLGAVTGLLMLALMAGEGMLSGDAPEMAEAVTSDGRGMIALVSIPGTISAFIAGFGLLRRRPWSWGLVTILACLSLLSAPIGTVIGVYALWTMTRPGTREALGVGAGSPETAGARPRRRIYVWVFVAISLLLILASVPTCQYGERAVQAELSKLSPEELQLRQFDIVYMRWVLPGIFLFFAGLVLAAVAVVSSVAERRAWRRKALAKAVAP
jgi:hypothetical protein